MVGTSDADDITYGKHVESNNTMLELVRRAELSATLVMSEIGLLSPSEQPHMEKRVAAYLASWVQVLKRDKNEIFKAAAEAQKIANYMKQWKPAIRMDIQADHNLDGLEGAAPASYRPKRFGL